MHYPQIPTSPGQVKQVVDLSAVAAPLCSPDPQVPPFLRLALTYALAAHLLVAFQCFITTFQAFPKRARFVELDLTSAINHSSFPSITLRWQNLSLAQKSNVSLLAAGIKGFNHNFRRVSHLFAKFVSNEHSKGLSTEGKARIKIRQEILHFTNRSRATIQYKCSSVKG